MNCDVGKAAEGLENELWRRWRDVRVGEWGGASFYIILQPLHRFTYVTGYSPTIPSLYLRHSSFPNHSVASPASYLILQPFFRFSYVTEWSLLILQPLSLHLRYKLILQPFCRFTNVTAHSRTIPFASPTSQFFLQPYFRFSYVTGTSPTSPGEPPVIVLCIIDRVAIFYTEQLTCLSLNKTFQWKCLSNTRRVGKWSLIPEWLRWMSCFDVLQYVIRLSPTLQNEGEESRSKSHWRWRKLRENRLVIWCEGTTRLPL